MHDRARTDPSALSAREVATALGVDLERGLDPEDASRRYQERPNELPAARAEGWGRRILRQVREPMALLLIAAATISATVLGETVEAAAIVAIVALNVVIALAQESRAEQALNALRDLETPHARVLRAGRIVDVPAREVASGDVVALREGDRVPADARLIDSHDLRVNESSLTGESLPARKDASAEPGEAAAMADRVNMVFSGTLVTHGSARAVVTGTGTATELGRIAEHLEAPRRVTPLQTELAALTRKLGAVAVLAALLAFALALLREGLSAEALERTFLSAVALAVAAVPEGLATVVTVALALGVSRMAEQGAIVRRLPAVETLGATTVIATDKTGTLTMSRFDVVDSFIPAGADLAREICALCSDATLGPPTGDELEIALLEWIGAHEVERLRAASTRLRTLPFDSDRKLMSVVVRRPDGDLVELVKGAPEEVLARCSRRATLDGDLPLTGTDDIQQTLGGMAREGLKVLALAGRRVAQEDAIVPETDLVFVGLLGLGDPIRPEAVIAVREAMAAGVSVVMVTGDHAATAEAIAAKAGMTSGQTITGADLERDGFPIDPLSVSVYARTTPEHKLRLVEALRASGETVAVTGDGVNDAPALYNADIGVAMGRAGTDVAKEASDLVITDDNLATIVAAIREGRGIYENIRRVVEYLVAANISEVGIVVVALLLFPELGTPLLPLQLLWINLITDGLPAVALGLDPASHSVMQRPPRRREDSLLGGTRLRRLILRGAALAAASLAALAVSRYVWDEPWSHARALMFTSIAFAQLTYAFAVRTTGRTRDEGTGLRAFSNRWLTSAAVAGAILQLSVILWEPARDLLRTATLGPREWLLVTAAALLPSALIVTAHRVRGLRSPT